MPTRHLIIGGGTAGMNAMRTIREEEREPSEITLVTAERPYSRMVLPYYLDRSIAESHVFTATAAQLAAWNVKTYIGRRATGLDVKANACTLDDGTRIEYDDCLIATGSSAVRLRNSAIRSARVAGMYGSCTPSARRKTEITSLTPTPRRPR